MAICPTKKAMGKTKERTEANSNSGIRKKTKVSK